MDAAAQWDLAAAREPGVRGCRTIARVRGQVAWPVIVQATEQLGGHGIMNWTILLRTARLSAELISLCSRIIIYIRGSARVVMDLLCGEGGCWPGWLRIPSPRVVDHSVIQPVAFSARCRICARWRKKSPSARVLRVFAGVDLIEETGTGRIYLLEFNPRAASGVRFGRHCGVGFRPGIGRFGSPA